MISDELRCIFLHAGRTGGSSVTRGLLPNLETKGEQLDNVEIYAKHKRPEWYIKHHPQEFADYLKFSFVRNPWDREVSRFNWQLYINQNRRGYFPEEFQQWMRERTPAQLKNSSYLGWLTLNGELQTDFVGRFETLNDDFQKLCALLSIERPALPHSNNLSNRPSYRDYYDDESREIVALAYAEDLRHFPYEF